MYHCRHCPKTFVTAQALGGHAASHRAGIKQYECISCGLATVNKKYCSNKCQHDIQSAEKIRLGLLNSGSLRKHLLRDRGVKCEKCGITDWQGQSITLEMDHIDGDHENNSLLNLKLLCPNCHSQTPTYRAKNKGNGRAYRMERYHQGKTF